MLQRTCEAQREHLLSQGDLLPDLALLFCFCFFEGVEVEFFFLKKCFSTGDEAYPAWRRKKSRLAISLLSAPLSLEFHTTSRQAIEKKLARPRAGADREEREGSQGAERFDCLSSRLSETRFFSLASTKLKKTHRCGPVVGEPLQRRHDRDGLDDVEEGPGADRDGVVAGEERREAVENVGEPVRNRRETDLCRKADKLEHHVQRLEQAPGRDAQHERAEQGLEEEGRVVLRGSRGGDDFYLFSDVRIRRRCRAPNGRCVSKRVRMLLFFPRKRHSRDRL